MFYREWTSVTNARCGNMIPVDKFHLILKRRDPGFCSVYAYSEEVALDIIASGSSAGFSRYTPASDWLIIDLDDGDKQLQKAIDVLKLRGIGFQVWSSGGKGYHLTVPHQFLHDKALPYSHQRYVEDMGLAADWTLYGNHSLVSLPGRIHKKTKAKKILIHTYEGALLELPLLPIPDKPEFRLTAVSDLEQRLIGIAKLKLLMTTPPELGQRHTRLWSCAENLAAGGFSYNAIEPLLQEINQLWDDPKSPEEVATAVEQAFRLIR